MYLTKNELEIMDVLWEQKRPLSRGELLALPEKKTWMDSSIHILLNSLLRKGAIREAGYAKCGKTSGRVYEAALSCAEYYVTTPLGQSRGPPGEIPWAPMGNHVGPHGQSRGPRGAITWAPRGNHVGPQGLTTNKKHYFRNGFVNSNSKRLSVRSCVLY